MRSFKPPYWLYTASAIPLIAILSFSVLVVWQWALEPAYNPLFPNSRERAYTFPLDQVSALTTIALPITHTDASSHLLGNAEEQTHKIDEVTEKFFRRGQMLQMRSGGYEMGEVATTYALAARLE